MGNDEVFSLEHPLPSPGLRCVSGFPSATSAPMGSTLAENERQKEGLGGGDFKVRQRRTQKRGGRYEGEEVSGEGEPRLERTQKTCFM